MRSISFNNKPYQETNFKCHLTSVLLCKKKDNVRFALVQCNFISLYLVMLTFATRLKSVNYKTFKYLSILRPMKIMSDLKMSPEKSSDFVSCLLVGFTLVIQLRNFDFKSH